MSLKSELFGTRALEQSHLCTSAEQTLFGLEPEVTSPPGWQECQTTEIPSQGTQGNIPHVAI